MGIVISDKADRGKKERRKKSKGHERRFGVFVLPPFICVSLIVGGVKWVRGQPSTHPSIQPAIISIPKKKRLKEEEKHSRRNREHRSSPPKNTH